MFGSAILDVAVGVFFVYLVLSLVCSILVEWISRRGSVRARILEEWVRRLFPAEDSQRLTERIYAHPLVTVIMPEGGRRPACIPPRNFALALVNILAPGMATAGDRGLEEIRIAVRTCRVCGDRTKNLLLALMDEAEGSLSRAIANIEQWFNDPMGSATRRYRAYVGRAILLVALLISLGLNLDTFMIADALWRQPAVREAAVAAAGGLAARPEVVEDATGVPDDAAVEVAYLLGALARSRIPLGWSLEEGDPRGLPTGPYEAVMKSLGLLLTAISASLGGPFWFDLIRKLLAARPNRGEAEGIC
jgi:hypothetical protein